MKYMMKNVNLLFEILSKEIDFNMLLRQHFNEMLKISFISWFLIYSIYRGEHSAVLLSAYEEIKQIGKKHTQHTIEGKFSSQKKDPLKKTIHK